MTTYKSVKYNISGADLTGLTAGQIPNLDTAKITTGTMADARISASSVSQHATTYDDNKLQTNIALLGFKTAVNGSLAKYNLVDQIVDEYTDATGVDASASTNEILTAGVYAGSTLSTVTKTFSYAGSDEAWTIPSGVTSLTVKAWGAGGGGGGNSGDKGAGGGGYATAVFTVTAGTVLTGVVGQGGIGWTTTTAPATAYGGGGGANGHVNNNANGGGGGGYSGLFVTSTVNQANAILIAGAGGGAGYSGDGGGGGGSTGRAGDSHTSGSEVMTGGGGGTDSAGGTAGTNGIAGSALLGGAGTFTTTYWGAGGGGGWYGGGSSSGASSAGARGAGGGSGYVRSSSFTTGVSAMASATNTQGSDGTETRVGGVEANNTDSDSSGTGGVGGDGGNGTNGENGALYVSYLSGTAGQDLTLQSNDTTASTANPDYADMVILMENAEGTATLNTDIKGFISEDSGVTFTEGTLVEEGTWGTDKKIIAFHDLDISAQTGSAMCYKITTHNQSAGSKETNIHATSIGWR